MENLLRSMTKVRENSLADVPHIADSFSKIFVFEFRKQIGKILYLFSHSVFHVNQFAANSLLDLGNELLILQKG